jgi:hypothetical protein
MTNLKDRAIFGVKTCAIAVPLNMRYTLDRLDKGFSLLFVPYQINNRYIALWESYNLNHMT